MGIKGGSRMKEPREIVLNDPNSVYPYIKELWEQLEQAKEIINVFLDFESVCMENGIKIADDIREKAENFLKE